MKEEKDVLNVRNKINSLVIKGNAPIAFYNSFVYIFSNKSNDFVDSEVVKVNGKYLQYGLPRLYPEKILSKIYIINEGN